MAVRLTAGHDGKPNVLSVPSSPRSSGGCASRKPARRHLAGEFIAVALPAKPRKKSTLIDYKATIANHLRPAFGTNDLGTLSQSPEAFERFAATKIKVGLSPKTVRNQLVLLGLMFKTARRWRWVSENPLELVDVPSMPHTETETLSAAVVALKAYRELEHASEKAERPWVPHRAAYDDGRTLHRTAERRAARAALAGRRVPRSTPSGSAGVRQKRDDEPEEQGRAADDPAW